MHIASDSFIRSSFGITNSLRRKAAGGGQGAGSISAGSTKTGSALKLTSLYAKSTSGSSPMSYSPTGTGVMKKAFMGKTAIGKDFTGKSAIGKVFATVNRLREIVSAAKDAQAVRGSAAVQAEKSLAEYSQAQFQVQTQAQAQANLNPVTYSRTGRSRTNYLAGRQTVSLSSLEQAFASAKAANLRALENPGTSITANNQDSYTGVASVVNGLNTHYLTDEYYFNGRITDAEKTAFDRRMVAGQINNILREHGVDLPDDFACEFVIDPDDYRITVDKCADSDLKNRLEQALNAGDDQKSFADRNGRNLYNHIYLSGKDYHNSQITHDGQLKRYVSDLVQEKTGICLSDCENTGTDFVTSDGLSVRELFLRQVEDEEKTSDNVASFKELRSFYLSQVQDFDFTDASKQVLRIGFSGGTLHDIGQAEDFGGDLGFIGDMLEAGSSNDARKTFTCFV